MKIKAAMAILSALGFIDSIYLLVIKYANNQKLCFIGAGDCLSVNNGVYSEIYGVPNAALGAIAYLVVFAFLLFESKSSLLQQWSGYLLFGLTFLGVIYSAYLTYLEIAVIKALCLFCMISAVIMLFLFILSIIRLFPSPTVD